MAHPILTISILISKKPENVRKCLESIQPILHAVPSELILTDTGCEKETRKIIEEYTDHIIDFVWCDDFAAARNAGLKEAKGQWFMWIDDDEWFEDTSDIIRFFQSENYDEYAAAFYYQRNYTDKKGTGFEDNSVGRIMHLQEGAHFEYSIHEILIGAKSGKGYLCSSFVHHFGYALNPEEEQEKNERNLVLLLKEREKNPNDLHVLTQLLQCFEGKRDWHSMIELVETGLSVIASTEMDKIRQNVFYPYHVWALYQQEKYDETIIYGEQYINNNMLNLYNTAGVLRALIPAYFQKDLFEDVINSSYNYLKIYREFYAGKGKYNNQVTVCASFLAQWVKEQLLECGMIAALKINDFESMELFGQETNYFQGQGEKEKQEGTMITFEKDFFEREERCGFVIEPMIKHCWAAQMEVLSKVDHICKENGITYFADWGTLLGAVRHKGYIPWDDDMDICMLRPDYIRFMDVIKNYSDDLQFYGIYNMEDWGMNASRVVNFTGFRIERDVLKKYHGCPYGIGIDIFPLDYVPREKELEEEQKSVIKMIANADAIKMQIENDSLLSEDVEVKEEYAELIRKIEEICHMEFSTKNPSRQELMILMEEVKGLYGEEDADYITAMHRLVNGQAYYVKKEEYEQVEIVSFENIQIPIPVGYDHILKLKYGDYMQMKNVGGGHDYPFYRKILKSLTEVNGLNSVEEAEQFVENVCRKYYLEYRSRSNKTALTFSQDFFEDNRKLRQTQAARLEVLQEIRRICKKHDISFVAVEETLQGAIETKGFLPGEERLTLGMKNNDFMDFLSIVQAELDSWFDYRSCYTHTGYVDEDICILTDGKYCASEDFLERFHGCEYTVGVRIIPLNEMPEKIKEVEFENTTIFVQAEENDDIQEEKQISQEPILTISILISNRIDNVKKCLESIQSLRKALPCEVILTDTGCGTEVRKIIEQQADRIIDFAWCRDFSAARNAGLKEATGQWFMYIDDDEWFEDTTNIIDFFNSGESKEYNVACYTQRNYTDYSGQNYTDHIVDRILRINGELHFEHRIHEAYTGIEIGQKKNLGSYVHHYGYVYKSEEEKQQKYKRNQELLELECQEHPEDMRMWHQLIMNQYVLRYWDRAIEIAEQAISIESESEYWDACHTDWLYCLEQKRDWQSIVSCGKDFIRKGLYPYESFGILQYMMEAYWNLGEVDKVYGIGQEALNLYQEYQEDENFFLHNQLMRKEFVSEDNIKKMMEYYHLAKENIGETKKVDNAQTNRKWNEDRLVFHKSFFEGETREAFYIEPMMKSAWAANLEVLRKIDKICEEYDIQYFVDWGTLLGTVRHKGFIPWDDDIDICMLRPDLERFLEVMENQQNELIYMNVYTDPDWGPHATKITNTTKFTVERKEIKEYYGFPFPAGIDVFPIDYVPKDKEQERVFVKTIRRVYEASHLKQEMEEYAPTSQEYIKGSKMLTSILQEIDKVCGTKLSEKNPTNQELMIVLDQLQGIYGEDESDYVTAIHRLAQGQDYYIPKEYYAKSIRMPFENIVVPVPVGYDMILKMKYGEDYMTPTNVRGGHDYPFYNTLIEALTDAKGDTEHISKREHIENISINYYKAFLNKDTQPTIQYDETNLSEETMDGVVVTEERKRIWAAQTEVLEEIKRICSKLNIKVFAIGETLVEAVNYHNYGPKSVDLHLAMNREDYVTFMNAFQEELDPWFDYGTVYSSENHEDIRTYIITDGYLCEEKDYLERFHGCPHIVGADISVVDLVNPDKQQDEVQKKIVEGLITTAQNVTVNPPYTEEELRVVEEWRRIAQIKINTEGNLRRGFLKAADQIGGAYRGDGEEVRITADLQEGKNTVLRKKWFTDTVEITFGNTTIPVPSGYQEIIQI